MAKWIDITTNADSRWKDGETVEGVFIGVRKPSGKGVKGSLLVFKANGREITRWSSALWKRLIADGSLRRGATVRAKALPMAGQGRKRFRPFSIQVKA